jgi:hypothetical protein
VRAPDLSVTLSRTAGQYLTLFFHQHTEAKDVITSKSQISGIGFKKANLATLLEHAKSTNTDL